MEKQVYFTHLHSKLLRWRLGIPLIENLPNIEACEKCGELLDVYGYHAVTCKRNNFPTRHQLVVDALARVLTSADIPLEMEVAIYGKERPADIRARRLNGSAPPRHRWYSRSPIRPDKRHDAI